MLFLGSDDHTLCQLYGTSHQIPGTMLRSTSSCAHYKVSVIKSSDVVVDTMPGLPNYPPSRHCLDFFGGFYYWLAQLEVCQLLPHSSLFTDTMRALFSRLPARSVAAVSEGFDQGELFMFPETRTPNEGFIFFSPPRRGYRAMTTCSQAPIL